MKDFLIIAITSPHFFKDENKKINHLFKNKEIDYLHIRKPYSSKEETEKLILEIDQEYYPYIKLHDHFDLTEKYPLGGIHLNSRNKTSNRNYTSISKSIHSLKEIDEVEGLDYFFISPIFDSISKAGYKSTFNLNDISEKIQGKKAIALGGITPDKFKLLKELGFSGAAMLGYFFQ